MPIRVNELKIRPCESADATALKAAQARLKARDADILSHRIVKKSVDARDKGDIRLIYSMDVTLAHDEAAWLAHLPRGAGQLVPSPAPVVWQKAQAAFRPVVAGLGPCGLFAALALAKAGLCPLVLERGEAVIQRKVTTARLMKTGTLNPESNLLFGEGGAGAFSDGKLTTGIKDPLCRQVLETLVYHGAPEEILYLARPHVGTDRLPQVVASIRRDIEALGGQVLFGARLTEAVHDKGRLIGIRYVQNGEIKEAPCNALLLALGHSARDTIADLHRAGLALYPKPFSLGLRIEHPQALIDRAQHGLAAALLPPAEYHLAMRARDGRGAYTFCMCPGGQVVPASSEPGMLCVNGMSPYKRDGKNANAALLVEVRPEDFMQGEDALSGFHFQRRYEGLAFSLGGGGFKAPVQLVGDFMSGRTSTALGEVTPTILPGYALCDLSQALPDYVARGIREAVLHFDRRLKGFASPDAVLTGVETRSSCPIQMARDERMRGSLPGVYPAGEGAGRAGGIMSAAVDGLRCANMMMENAREGDV